jgi:predicted GIY-YIG superfamily endonuclease
MSFYIFILTDSEKRNMIICRTKDVHKALDFYHGLPQLPPLISGIKLNQLIWLEEWIDDQASMARFEDLNRMTMNQKIGLIESLNPDWVPLIPGVNIEL